jgi:hypothetical protein
VWGTRDKGVTNLKFTAVSCNPSATVDPLLLDGRISTIHHASSQLLVLVSGIIHINSIIRAPAQFLHNAENVLMTTEMRMRMKEAMKVGQQ